MTALPRDTQERKNEKKSRPGRQEEPGTSAVRRVVLFFYAREKSPTAELQVSKGKETITPPQNRREKKKKRQPYRKKRMDREGKTRMPFAAPSLVHPATRDHRSGRDAHQARGENGTRRREPRRAPGPEQSNQGKNRVEHVRSRRAALCGRYARRRATTADTTTTPLGPNNPCN